VRDIPEALAVSLASGVTTLCNCWKIIRRDGEVLGFTDHDEPLAFDDLTFLAGTGFEGTEIEARLGLAATGSELHGAIADESLRESDLAAGRYDSARVELYLVDWSAPENRLLQRVGEIGEVRREGAAFAAEIRGLAHRFDQERGRLYTASCDAVLGDARCGVDLDDPAFRCEGSVAAANGSHRLQAVALDTFEDGWFSRGNLLWLSGANEGLACEVKEHRGSELALWQAPPEAIEPGDTFIVTAGCDKRFETCQAKFANAENFRGFPHLPGNDFVVAYAVPGEPGHDGEVAR
jgi:uncharacterized phage protein (TIGR02218 family)